MSRSNASGGRKNGDKRTIQSLEQGFTIIETVKRLNGATATEIADELDLPNSTTHVYVTTLADLGFLDKRDNEYSLSLRFLEYGGHVRNQLKLHNVARTELEELAQKTDEVAALGVEDRGQRVLLYLAKGEKAVYDGAPVGEYAYLHRSALGKALLANLPEERRDAIIDDHGLPASTEHTITDPDALAEALATVRDRGYSLEDEERYEGIRSVGVPLSNEGRVIGAISISGPKNRLTDERIRESLVPGLQDAANVIELRYTHE